MVDGRVPFLVWWLLDRPVMGIALQEQREPRPGDDRYVSQPFHETLLKRQANEAAGSWALAELRALLGFDLSARHDGVG
jgi:hypothetical protein